MAASSTGPAGPPWPVDTLRLAVDDLQIDLSYRRVERPDGHTELPNRMFELLLVFLAEPRVLHTRTALFERVWSGVVVEDANLSQSVWMLRKALGLERRHWIRTVAGSGYVFEPPAAVEVAVAEATDPPGGAATPAPPPQRPSVNPGRRWVLPGVLALLVCLAAGIAAWQQARNAAGTVPQVATAVALIEVGKPAAGDDAGWPATLLHGWLGWKLGQLPEVTVLTEADLAADVSPLEPVIVLLSSGQSTGEDGELFLRVRMASDAGGEGFQAEVRGSPAQMPALVDELSRQLLATLAPARAASRWPGLDLDADGARGYVEVHEAVLARDWPGVVSRAQQLMHHAPGFGLIRLDLAHAQARLGQTAAAMEQVALARRLLQPLPDEAERLLAAQELSVNPSRIAQAAEAYGALAREYPQRPRLALEQARLLVRTGNAEQALQILSGPVWERQPTGIQVSRQLGLARAGLLRGDPEGTRASAREAARLAQIAGQGWELERGYALMMMGQAELILMRRDAGLVMLEQAARQFDAAGSTVNADYMRYQAELVQSAEAADSPMLETLLQEARQGGYRNVEIELLRLVAYRHYQAGQHDRFRERLDQAFAVAREAGNAFWQNQMDLDLLNEDVMLGDLDSAGRRVARLREMALEGDRATWVAHFDAYLLQLRGLTGQALAVLEQNGQATPAGDTAVEVSALTAARTSCARAGVFLQQGDMARARDELVPCKAAGHPGVAIQARLLEAELMQLGGHARQALAQLEAAGTDMEALALQGPDRLWLLLARGALLSRSGMPDQARALFDEVRARAGESGHGWMLALAETGMAEAAAASGDWDAGERHLAAAWQYVPEDTWLLARRLEQVAIVLSLARGEGDRASELLARLDAQAHLFMDAPAVLEVHSLAPARARPDGCREHASPALAADKGLAGADLSWLTASLPTRDGRGLAHAEENALAER